MRARRLNAALLLQNWASVLILSLALCSELQAFTTSSNVTVQLGEEVTLTCELQGDEKVILVEWTRCNGQQVLVFSPTLGQHMDKSYEGRISNVMERGYTLLGIQKSDLGAHCCKLNTFPSGTLDRQIHLLLRKDTGKMGYTGVSTATIASIAGGLLGVVVLGAIAGLVICKRRGGVRNPVHVAVHPTGFPRNQPSVLQKSPDPTPSQKRSDPGDYEEDEEEGIDYLNVPNPGRTKPVPTVRTRRT